MQVERFFQSTRGKIVAALRMRHSASAIDLAGEFQLSPNAIRQQLMVLERDGMVETRPVRRGKTKPTLEYTLTARAEEFFPQQYDRMLNAVLREVRLQGGDEAVERIFAGMAERTRTKMHDRLEPHATAEGKVVELTSLLQRARRRSRIPADRRRHVRHPRAQLPLRQNRSRAPRSVHRDPHRDERSLARHHPPSRIPRNRRQRVPVRSDDALTEQMHNKSRPARRGRYTQPPPTLLRAPKGNRQR